MVIFSTENTWAFSRGLLGNIISFVVFLASAVCKKKTTEGFRLIPYVVALFSAMLWFYYASLKTNAFLLIALNSVGSVVETVYVALYLVYAPKQAKMIALRLAVLLNFGGFCSIVLLSRLFPKRTTQVQVRGWVCDVVAVSVFAAPLSIMRVVIRTKSIEFMPVLLSFLMLSAVTWLLYGISLKDIYIAEITEGKVNAPAVREDSLSVKKQGVLDIESSYEHHAGNGEGRKGELKREESAHAKLPNGT